MSASTDVSPRRTRILVTLSALVILTGAFVFALARSQRVRHATAQSLRGALGPPSPAPLLIEDDPPPPMLVSQQLAARQVIIPNTAPIEAAPIIRPPDLDGVSFVLLLGADNRTSKVTGRTDAMLVAGFRHRDGEIAVFSIPRDLWVPLPDVGSLHEQGHTHARISSVVRVGEVRLGPGQGIPLLRQTLHEQLGIRIDRYASVDFAGFTGMVDEFGGVDVDVDCPIIDCFWQAGDDQACTLMNIDAGRIHMDGATALQFVRSRHGTGDRDRTKRQQAVLLAFARKVQARGVRGLRPLWTRAQPYVRTDLDGEDAAYYASFALDNTLTDLHGFAVHHPMVERHVTEDGKHVLLLDRPTFDRALDGLFRGSLPGHHERKRCPEPDAALR